MPDSTKEIGLPMSGLVGVTRNTQMATCTLDLLTRARLTGKGIILGRSSARFTTGNGIEGIDTDTACGKMGKEIITLDSGKWAGRQATEFSPGQLEIGMKVSGAVI